MTKFSIIFDIETRNNLKKECNGDVSKLRIGIVGIKLLNQNKFLFFGEGDIQKLERILLYSDMIIGYNIIGHNGLDFQILENYGISTHNLVPKTYDLMTSFIRAFGSFKNMSLDNIAEHTLGIKKKPNKRAKANYKLIQNGELDKVKENLTRELTIIENLYNIIKNGGVIRFETPNGLIDEHEIPRLGGFFPSFGEEIIEPYDISIGGMRLQIKDPMKEISQCHRCKKSWNIRSISYFGDTDTEKVYCPNCGAFLTEVTSNFLGPRIEITEIPNANDIKKENNQYS